MQSTTSEAQWRELIDAARRASAHAYCAYSAFAVGAAVLSDDGRVFTGCNVENASYGLTICAERNAIAHAIVSGARTMRAVAVYTPTQIPASPCGACRQVLAELAPDAEVLCVCEGVDRTHSSVASLLPGAFALKRP